MHEVLVNRLGGLSLPRKSVVKLTDRPGMTLDVYRGRKTTIQQQHQHIELMFILKAIKSRFKGHMIKRILHLWSFHMKFMKLIEGSFHTFHMK